MAKKKTKKTNKRPLKGSFRSSFEKRASEILTKVGVQFEYEVDTIPYVLSLNYLPDFKLSDENIYVETKGFFKPEDRRKLRAVKKANPDLDIRIWFQRDNYLNKTKKSKYSDWAIKNGFPYIVGEDLESILTKKGGFKWLNVKNQT